MSPQPADTDLSAALFDVAVEARNQESYAQELLLGKLTRKAADDPEFREELRAHPERVVRREAGDLQVAVTKGVVESVKVLSAAIPGADADKVQKLIFMTIEDMRKSFTMTLQLSQWLFFAGLVMVAGAFCAALFEQKLWAAGIAGGSGSLSLLLSAVMNPLDRIRGAAGNLAQIQAAYLAFYKQLYILGVGVEQLSRDEAIAYAHELQQAANVMVESIGGALDKNRPEKIGAKAPSAEKGKTQGSPRNKRTKTIERKKPAPASP